MLNRDTLFKESKKRKCLNDYSIKSEYMNLINPFLKRDFTITTKFEYSDVPNI